MFGVCSGRVVLGTSDPSSQENSESVQKECEQNNWVLCDCEPDSHCHSGFRTDSRRPLFAQLAQASTFAFLCDLLGTLCMYSSVTFNILAFVILSSGRVRQGPIGYATTKICAAGPSVCLRGCTL